MKSFGKIILINPVINNILYGIILIENHNVFLGKLNKLAWNYLKFIISWVN